LLDALSVLDDADVLAVWRHAEGVADDLIATEIAAATGQQMSLATIRQRRARALDRVRTMLRRNG